MIDNVHDYINSQTEVFDFSSEKVRLLYESRIKKYFNNSCSQSYQESSEPDVLRNLEIFRC